MAKVASLSILLAGIEVSNNTIVGVAHDAAEITWRSVARASRLNTLLQSTQNSYHGREQLILTSVVVLPVLGLVVVLPDPWFLAGVLGFEFWGCTPAAAATPTRTRAMMLPKAVN